MPALSKAQRTELKEKLLEAYPTMEPCVLDILLDVFEKDSRWLQERMNAELRREKLAAKNNTKQDAASQTNFPAS